LYFLQKELAEAKAEAKVEAEVKADIEAEAEVECLDHPEKNESQTGNLKAANY
jgi:hypothetical protein